MQIVRPGKKDTSTWEVAWMWLPHFLAQDSSLHIAVDAALSERWVGVSSPDAAQMQEQVIDLITNKYPIPGLSDYLKAVDKVREIL